MTEPGTGLFEAIRRDHRAGMRLPSELAARHGTTRQAVLDAVCWITPAQMETPPDELRAYEQTLDELLAEDADRPLQERREVFALYHELRLRHNVAQVSYRWVWDYVTRRARQGGAADSAAADAPGQEASPGGRRWGSTAGPEFAPFIADLLACAARHLAELAIEADQPTATAVELGLVSTGAALDLIRQAMNEIALIGSGSGLSYAQMSKWSGIPEQALAQQTEDYHRLMTL
jgi:hypothetical protein